MSMEDIDLTLSQTFTPPSRNRLGRFDNGDDIFRLSAVSGEGNLRGHLRIVLEKESTSSLRELFEPWTRPGNIEKEDDRKMFLDIPESGDGRECDRCGKAITCIDWSEDWGYNGLCARCREILEKSNKEDFKDDLFKEPNMTNPNMRL